MSQHCSDQLLDRAADRKVALGMLMGMIIGIAIGPALGAAVHDTVAGLAIGIGVGGSASAVIGTALQKPRRAPTKEEVFPFATLLSAGMVAFVALTMIH